MRVVAACFLDGLGHWRHLKVRLSRSIDIQDDEFEWVDDKAARNLADHGVSFEAARDVFDDAFAIEREDLREDYGEDRYTIIGMVDGRLIFVAYTLRGDRIRIIMARYAEPFERRLYYDANS
jgi:hypothetical protein